MNVVVSLFCKGAAATEISTCCHTLALHAARPICVASGGALLAGRLNIAAHDGGSFAIAEYLFATADAYGFAAYPGSSFLTPGTADALGGAIGTGAAGGSFSAAELHISASGFAGDAPGVAGQGTGGRDRKSAVSGKSVYVRVDIGGRRLIKKNKNNHQS